MSGKGDTYRPVDADRYARNYDAIDWSTEREETEMPQTPTCPCCNGSGIGDVIDHARPGFFFYTRSDY